MQRVLDLWSQHKRVVELAREGFSEVEISSATGLSEDVVKRQLGSKMGRRLVAEDGRVQTFRGALLYMDGGGRPDRAVLPGVTA